VLREQPAIAAYWNPEGEVIRQRGGITDDHDAFVFITEYNLPEFIDRLCDLADIAAIGRG